MSTRTAAKSANLNRGTCGKYFRLWDEALDPNRTKETVRFIYTMSPALKRQLKEAAVVRKMTLSNLVGFMLEVIIEEGLIPAILDEGPTVT